MAISDERQRVMPMPVDRETGEVLDYKEAVLLTNPTNPDLKVEVGSYNYLEYICLYENIETNIHHILDHVSVQCVTISFKSLIC